MVHMSTEPQFPPSMPALAEAHKVLEPELEIDNEASIKAEKGSNQGDCTKGPPSGSPAQIATELVQTSQPASSGPRSNRSPSPSVSSWAHWIDREPEIRRRTAVDWISAYEQELHDPALGHYVVLYAFYDKEARPSGSNWKPDEGDTVVEEVRKHEEPLKIIIRSFHVIDELKEVTGVAFPHQECILKPPFKILTQYWPDIKRHLCHLKEEASSLPNPLNSHTNRANSGTDIPKPAVEPARMRPGTIVGHPGGLPPDPSGDWHRPPLPLHQRGPIVSEKEHLQRRIAHLELLVEFGEEALKRHLDLRAQVQDRTLQRIAFSDLWHLYNPGDLLLANERGNPQLYMVFNVTGGQPRLRNPTENESRVPRPRFVPRPPGAGGRGPRRGWYDAAEGSDSYTSVSSDAYNTTMHDTMIGTCTPFVIDCYAFNVDSTGVGTLCSRKKIRKYLGLKNVLDLPLYPLKFHKDAQSILNRLQDRGRKFISSKGHRRYDGVTYDSRGIASRERLQGEIYIDADEYARSKSRFVQTKLCLVKRTNPVPAEVEESPPNRTGRTFYLHHDHAVDQRKSDVFIEKNPEIQELLARDDALIMPEKLQLMQHSLHAFSFKSRSWVNIEIDNVDIIDKSQAARESGFQDLSIPSKHRKLLISLVDNHALRDEDSDDRTRVNPKPSTQLDLVRGKGLGLIILLHGPPGSGKTSTAETIAAHTGRPLYAITCGDLGEALGDIETRLDVHSKRADKWGAVLLLDEADVFLMRRDWKDTHRNAMVSIFLRTLEYYQGILFLTTNRVGVIDEAFKSRIHVSLRYPKVKLKSTLEIWESTLNRIERDNEQQDIKVEFDRDELLDFANAHFEAHAATDGSTWNGRQIRNAFQTAIALGQYDRVAKIHKRGLTPEQAFLSGKKKWRVVKLTRKNLETLAETARDFDKYLKSVHRLTDGELARSEDVRRDDFSDLEDEAVGSRSFLSPGSAAKLKKGLGGGGRNSGKSAEAKSPRASGSKAKGKQTKRHSNRDSNSDSEDESEVSVDRDRAGGKSVSESDSDEVSDD